jgi:hypothetical protein
MSDLNNTQDIIDLQLNKIQETKKIIKNKNKIYPKERKELLKKVFDIILDDDNGFYSHHIENSEEIKQQIENLNEDIFKYFSISRWPSFNKDLNIERKTMSTIRSLLRDMHIEYDSVTGKTKENNVYVNTTRYKILNKPV